MKTSTVAGRPLSMIVAMMISEATTRTYHAEDTRTGLYGTEIEREATGSNIYGHPTSSCLDIHKHTG